jgi:arylsulfatase
MLIRHTLWKEKYPDKPKARGIPFTGIDNARPETIKIGEDFEKLRADFPFDPLEFIQFNMPDALKVTQRVDAVD